MISGTELALLLLGSERDADLDFVEHLIVTGLSAFAIDADALSGRKAARSFVVIKQASGLRHGAAFSFPFQPPTRSHPHHHTKDRSEMRTTITPAAARAEWHT